MSWDAFGAMGELVGALAVLASLIYLARQIRHSMESNRISNYHEAQQQLWSAAEIIAGDAVLSAEIGKSLNKGLDQVSPESLVRVEFIMASFFFGMENMLSLYEKGQIDVEQWQNVFDNNYRFIGSALGHDVITQRPGAISGRLKKLIDDRSGVS